VRGTVVPPQRMASGYNLTSHGGPAVRSNTQSRQPRCSGRPRRGHVAVRLELTDDSGFLALIDPDAYSGFVGPDWQLNRLFEVFHEHMARRAMLLWGTRPDGGCWTVEVSMAGVSPRGTREVWGTIRASQGRLCVTNYESLTMAAQFDDVALPEAHDADCVWNVEPGLYDCHIVQVSQEPRMWDRAASPDFCLRLYATAEPRRAWVRIPWVDECFYRYR